MGSISWKTGSGNRRSFKRSRGSSNIKPYHGGDRSFLERDPGDWKQGRAGRAAFRENEPHIKVFVSGSANGLRSRQADFIANILGLGWAATPAGLKAMKELEKIEEMRRKEKSTVGAAPKGTASNEMCTFLVMNISSLQLIPVNIIAYRSQYHSVSAAAVTGPCLVATMVSTLAAVFFCRIMDRSNKKGNVL